MSRELLSRSLEHAVRYLEAIGERPVPPAPEAVERLAQLDESLPEDPTPPLETLDRLDALVSPATMAMAGPRFFGLVVGGALPATVAANWLATAWDQNAAAEALTPGVAALERMALRWLLELFGLPVTCAGGFVTGATMANLCGLAAARHRQLARAGWDVERDGLFGAPAVRVVGGEEVHPTVRKALGILGFGRERVHTVPVDARGCMRADALPALDGPTIVCTQAGNVNTGASDPFPEVVARAREAGAWVHVDGAFGLWAAAAPERAHQVRGMQAADSWATDAHKWLNVPYDSGIAFVRDADALRAALSVTAAYLPAGPARDPYDTTPEMSRRARGVEVWTALRTLGRRGVADLVERCCRHAERFAAGLRAAGHQVLNDVPLNQVLVTFGNPDRTRRVIEAVQRDGTCWCGPTTWQGRTAMRISVSSHATTEKDVDRSLEAIVRIARQL